MNAANKPMPRIYAPTVESKRAVIRAIYAQGWRLSGNPNIPLEDVVGWMSDGSVIPLEWVYVHEGDRAFAISSDAGTKGLPTVNSVAHLISYCKSLGPRGPKVV